MLGLGEVPHTVEELGTVEIMSFTYMIQVSSNLEEQKDGWRELVIALVAFNDFLLQLHFELFDEGRADASLFAVT